MGIPKANELTTLFGGEWVVRPDERADIATVVDDSRAVEPNSLFVAVKGLFADGHRFAASAAQAGASVVCVERTPSPNALSALRSSHCGVWRVPDTLQAFHALAAHHRCGVRNCAVVGLTGSSGKTSAKEMLAAILRRVAPGEVLWTEGNLNNHFGVPRTLFRLREGHRFAVVEMGTNQPGDIAQLAAMVKPDLGVITSIGAAHLEKLGSLDGVAREKSEILRALSRSGVALVPGEAPRLDILRAAAGGRKTVLFGRGQACDVRAEYAGWTGEGFGMALRWRARPERDRTLVWPVGGAHQALNAAAAAAAATELGVDMDDIVAGLADVRLPGMRTRTSRHGGVLWVNDAYNANPDSMRAGLSLFAEIADREGAGRRVLVLGDMLELGNASEEEHDRLLDAARKHFPKAQIVAVGPRMSEAGRGGRADVCVASAAEARHALDGSLPQGTAVFLKGSRGMRLEEVLPEARRGRDG